GEAVFAAVGHAGLDDRERWADHTRDEGGLRGPRQGTGEAGDGVARAGDGRYRATEPVGGVAGTTNGVRVARAGGEVIWGPAVPTPKGSHSLAQGRAAHPRKGGRGELFYPEGVAHRPT